MKNSIQSILVAACLSAALFVTAPVAQFVPAQERQGELLMQTDYAVFRDIEPGKMRIEVYYKIFNRGFEYRQEGDQWLADYEFLVTLDKDNVQVDRHQKQRTIKVANERQTRSLTDYRISLISFVVDPGKYKLACYLTDRNGDGSFRFEAEIKVNEPDNAVPQLSDILYAGSVVQQGDEPNPFDRGNIVVVPSVSRGYGSGTDSRLIYYLEIYEGTRDLHKVVVETKIRKHRGGMVYRDTLTAVLDEPMERRLQDISLNDFSPGQYELEVNLRGRRFKKLDQLKSVFQVMWSDEALIEHDFETALDQLELIADNKKLKALKDAGTQAERKAAFDKFWADNDPTPGTAENEWKKEFYRRVAVANHQFAILRREGWRTDRGRVFIQHGEPDEFEDVPFAPDYPPYQVWHYYQEGRYRRFTFVDENMDGDYRLVYPFDGLNQRPDF